MPLPNTLPVLGPRTMVVVICVYLIGGGLVSMLFVVRVDVDFPSGFWPRTMLYIMANIFLTHIPPTYHILDPSIYIDLIVSNVWA